MQAKMKNIELIYEADPAVPQVIFTDEKRLKQVFLNLMGNSLKFTCRGHIKLQASIKQIRTEDSQTIHKLEFSVSDSGVGIKSQDISKLFKLFGKLESKNNLNKQGVGLGLTFSKKIIEKLGGQIEVSSKIGEGTTFKFWIET